MHANRPLLRQSTELHQKAVHAVIRLALGLVAALPLLPSAWAAGRDALGDDAARWHYSQRYPEGERLVEMALGRIASASGGTVSFAYDSRLASAATDLARQVLALPGNAPLSAIGNDRIQNAVYDAWAWDPSPTAVVLRGGDLVSLSKAMADHPGLRSYRFNRFGIAILSDGGRENAGVILLADRKAALSAFPSRCEVGRPVQVKGKLAQGLKEPELAVTGPDGRVIRQKLPDDGNGGFGARLTFSRQGRSLVEVLAKGKFGVMVAAMFPVDVGGRSESGRLLTTPQGPAAGEAFSSGIGSEAPVEGTGAEAASQAFNAINALRVAAGLRPLARDAKLDALALHHGMEMGRLGFFGHESPVEGAVGDRLRAARVPFAIGAENLAEASNALAAHRLIETSPGHRSNLLEPGLDRVGVGLALSPKNPGNVYLVEIFVGTGAESH